MPPLYTDSLQLLLTQQDSARLAALGWWPGFNPAMSLQDGRLARIIDTLRSWHTVELIGQHVTDSLSISAIKTNMQAILADTGHAGGVRVRLAKKVAYASLVELLDIMIQFNQKKYWLDMKHQPVMLYAITNAPMTLEQRRNYLAIACQGSRESSVITVPYTSPPLTFTQQLANLQQPERSPLLLLTIGCFVLLLAALIGQRLLLS